MSQFKHYFFLLRLHRPAPILLLIWPVMWALWIASHGAPSIKLIAIFCVGAFVMRSCGVIINDLRDRKLDGQVERTKNRPLATGKVSVTEAIVLAIILAAIAFGLVLTLNRLTIELAFGGMALTLLYPITKRLTHFPQLILGVSFNWGVLMAFSAVLNHIPTTAYFLLGITIIWTLAYDTIYARADQKDDILMGIKSTAVLFRQFTILAVVLFQLVMLGLLLAFGLSLHFNVWFYVSLGVCLCFFYGQHKMMSVNTIKANIDAFTCNHWVGMAIFLGIALQYVQGYTYAPG